jgi:ribonuclease P/MRP protein subunit RPP1
MKITDAAVYPYPCGDSSVLRMATEARALGFDSVVAIDTPAREMNGITVLNGIQIRDTGVREVISRVRKAKDTGAVISVQAGDNGFNRAVISQKGVHSLTGIHTADKTAFDHVSARMAADNRVAIDLDLSAIVCSRGIARQRAIHQYRDILVLRHRFEFPLTISSHSRSILDMRSVREITGLCSLLGMDMPDVEQALAGVGIITTSRDPAVKVIR